MYLEKEGVKDNETF